MTLERFPENDYKNKENSYLEATKLGDFQTSLNYSVPGEIPPRKGRVVAFVIIILFMMFLGYTVWNNFLRYDSYGVVEADVVGVYTTTPGVVKSLDVAEGSVVKKGDFIAQIESNEDLRNLSRITDEISVAQSELSAKKEENKQRVLLKQDSILQVESQIADINSSLSELKTHLVFQKEEVARFTRLASKNAAGAREIDSVRSQLASLLATIRGKEESLHALKNRLFILKTQSSNDAFLAPIEAKIISLNNEKKRLSQKIQEGSIYSQVSGMVSFVMKKPTELVKLESIINVVVENTMRFVLFYDPSDRIPTVGTVIKVKVPSLNRLINAEVTSISRDVIAPPDQIKSNYRANQKLIKIFLKPSINDLNTFVVGSVIKRPSTTDLIYNTFNQASNLTVPSASAKSIEE